MAGALRDGWNSLYRYFLNNFYDGYRQVRVLYFQSVFMSANIDVVVAPALSLTP